jgi:hypothetical protein
MRKPTSVTRILVVLGVILFSSPTFSVTSESETEKAQQGSFGTVDAEALLASKGTGTLHSFGVRIAGTYLATPQPVDGPSRILNIFADGNLTSIQSNQFSAGAIGDVKTTWFSNQHGTWKRVGKFEIEATVLDLDYDPSTGDFLGTAIARYNLQFDKMLQTVTGSVKGKIFQPGVDPLNPGENKPIAKFSDTFLARRVIVGK